MGIRRALQRPLGAPERARALPVAALVLVGCVLWLTHRGTAADVEARALQRAHAVASAPRRTSATPTRVARTFLAGFLPYSYGLASPPRPGLLTPALRAELANADPAGSTGRRARPRTVSLALEAIDATRARFVAGIDDGRGAYPLTLELVHSDRWRVAAVEH